MVNKDRKLDWYDQNKLQKNLYRPTPYLRHYRNSDTLGKTLWFVNKNDFGVNLHFFEIFNQFCIDKKLLLNKCVKAGNICILCIAIIMTVHASIIMIVGLQL